MTGARTARLALALAAAVGMASCDLPTDGRGGSGGPPTGLSVVTQGGAEVAGFSGGSVRGSVTVSVNASETFHVVLTTRAGSGIAVDGLRYTLHATAVNGAVARVEQPGTDQVRVTGRAAGETRLVLTVLDAGAALFPAVYVPLTVRGG